MDSDADLPLATVVPPPPGRAGPSEAGIDADLLSSHGDSYLLSGTVVITYRGRELRADTITYNAVTHEADASGHLRLSDLANNETLQASHGNYNLRSGTGRFYDVTGSVGLTRIGHLNSGKAPGLISPNPFLFSGRIVIKNGPDSYEIFDGSVTSCLLPNPDWQLSSHHFVLADGKAHASLTLFRLLGLPVLVLPYVSHPVDTEQRQSGLLIPVLGQSSSKGFIVGEQFYITLGRSADLTLGSTYFSERGFSESSTFRYRGVDLDYFNAHFSALQDRGYTPTGGVYTNQGGEDVTTSFRRRFTAATRALGSIEYLSSYVYREAFTDSFNLAISSDITSIAYLTHENDGFALDGRTDRYQGLKRVETPTTAGQEVRIFHAPSLDLTGVDRPIPGTPLLWSLTASAGGLKRVQPDFATGGLTQRIDLRPELSLPLSGGGWHTLSSIAVRETAYSRSRVPVWIPGAPPVELTEPLNRSSLEMQVDIRPPAIERTFAVPAGLQRFFGTEVRHTIEPDVTWRNVRGISNFLGVLRFDDVDLASDTDELEYGVTQHLYFRPRVARPAAQVGCPEAPSALLGENTAPSHTAPEDSADVPSALDTQDALGSAVGTDPDSVATGAVPDQPLRTENKPQRGSPHDPCAAPALPSQQEWFSWRLAQKHFFDPSFGGAVQLTRRNIFETTLDFSGIAFLTEPRSISPLISRMRFRTSGHTDVEWDFDVDTGAGKLTSNNVFLDAHEGRVFGGLSYALLQAPGRFYTENLDTDQLVGSPTSNFSQMRLLLGYGEPSRPGLSVAANAGLDLKLGSVQYAALQTSYNWNCCGLSIEYRKFELGSVRNENVYRFNFTLANIGTAGNLRRSERLF